MKFTAVVLLIASASAIQVRGDPKPKDEMDSFDKNYDSIRFGALETQKKENAWTNGEKKVLGSGPPPIQSDGTQPMDERKARPMLAKPHVDDEVDVPEAKRFVPKDATDKAFHPPRVGKKVPEAGVIASVNDRGFFDQN